MASQASKRKSSPSLINGPPTPPLTDITTPPNITRILKVFRDYQNDTPPSSPWTVLELKQEEYVELQDLLDHDDRLGGFVASYVRYDYSPLDSRLVIRMNTVLHDTFIQCLVTEFQRTLRCLAEDNIEARPFIEGIRPVAGALTYFGNDDQTSMFRHVPDMSFQHLDAVWPGIVIEVAHSLKQKDLVYLADDYIVGSGGDVGVVVGLNLDYKKSKAASISIWRSKFSKNEDGALQLECERVVDNELFRDTEGNHLLTSSSSLKLSLKDLAIAELTRRVPDLPIEINSQTLCRLLGEAEGMHERRKNAQVSLTKVKRKYRDPTPPERLTASDEENFVEDERRVMRKLEELDANYDEEKVLPDPIKDT